jgi:RNA polymerase sigma factor (TIGR02999 family)
MAGGDFSGGEVTLLLRAWQAGDETAGERLTPLIYEELRRVARLQLRREGPGATLRPTELVHEGYLRLLGQRATFENRAHFLALAATVMRRILVDRARRRRAARRSGEGQFVTLGDVEAPAALQLVDVVALDQVLANLAGFDPTQARLIELHFFGGLTFAEVASVLGLSESSVYREWRVARLWLLKQLSGSKNARGAVAPD